MQFNTLYPHAGLLLKLHTYREGGREEGGEGCNTLYSRVVYS